MVIHTTNYLAAPGMVDVLQASGWNVGQVVPYGDLDWLEEVWLPEVRRAMS